MSKYLVKRVLLAILSILIVKCHYVFRNEPDSWWTV